MHGKFSVQHRGLSRSMLHQVKQAMPITPEILLALLKFVNFESSIDITLWCCFVLTFLLFAWKSNMVPPSQNTYSKQKHLQRGDIKRTSFGLTVNFKSSKTIKFDVHCAPRYSPCQVHPLAQFGRLRICVTNTVQLSCTTEVASWSHSRTLYLWRILNASWGLQDSIQTSILDIA